MPNLAPDTIEEIIETIAVMNGDDPEERRGVATATVAKLNKGEPVTGLPAFIEQLDLQPFEKTLRRWLRQPASVTAANPDAIRLDEPRDHITVTAVASRLAGKSERIYDRKGTLSRIKRVKDAETLAGVNRDAGSVRIVPVDPAWLAFEAGSLIAFQRGTRPASPSISLMSMVMSAADDFDFRPLIAVSLTPSIDRDEPGYDLATGIYFDFPAGLFPQVPMAPSKGEAEQALARLLEPLRGFPFVNPLARSVAASAMLAAVHRPMMRTCPMIQFDAPAARTGKTKLAVATAVLALGTAPATIAYTGRPDEDEKRLDSVLRAGDPVLLIDNVSAEIEGDALCSILTNETVQPRTLGKSETVKLGTRVLILVTGNNLRVRGDVAHRSIVCKLDARMANPDERPFDFDPVDEVRRDRAALVMAALTVLRAHRATGASPSKLKPFGGFDDFDLIRGALVWLGLPDPADSRDLIRGNDSALEERVLALGLIAAHVGVDIRFTVQMLGAHPRYAALRGELLTLLGLADWSGAKIGQLLRRCRGVPTHGLVLKGEPTGANVTEWWVIGEANAAMLGQIAALGGEAM
jgi:hypothetical protein